MISEPVGEPQKDEHREPPKRPRPPIIVRIFRALKRYENRHRRRRKKERGETEITMARWAKRVGWFTLALVIVGSITGVILYWQLLILRESIVTDERPWVSIENVKIASPLFHDDVGWKDGPRWHMLVSYQLKNYGKTPAAHVFFWGHLLPDVPHFQDSAGKWHGMFLETDTLDACSYPEFATKFGIDAGQLLFPGVETPIKYFDIFGYEYRFTDIMKAKSLVALGVFSIPICVTYSSVFTKFQNIADLSKGVSAAANRSVFGTDQYLTALDYRLGTKSRRPIDLKGETIKSDDLTLGEPGFQGSYAK